MFSSPIGAFIFLILLAVALMFTAFLFSSPIGAFIFLISFRDFIKQETEFSSPIGAFIFLMHW